MNHETERARQIREARAMVGKSDQPVKAGNQLSNDEYLKRITKMLKEQDNRARRIETRLCKLADALGVDIYDL